MQVRRAVITAAHPDQRALPLQALIDIDGQEKSALQIVLEEVLDAGAEEICLVVCPGDESLFREVAGPNLERVQFVEQDNPRGYGDALRRTTDFTAGEPFLHLVSDHLYLSRRSQRCARQLVEAAQTHDCAVSAVQPTRETLLPQFGAVGGRRVPQRQDLYVIEDVMEKPTPTQAEQRLIVPGLRAGHYLCFFGMHVLTPRVMELLCKMANSAPDDPINLSAALRELSQQQRYLALDIYGTRFNIGVRYGLLYAQLAYGLAGRDRDQILSQLVQQLAGDPPETPRTRR